MEITELIENLKEQSKSIKQENLEELDFDRLEQNLNSASDMLEKLQGKKIISDKILNDYKSEIKRLALSLSRLKGENANLELIEMRLQDENLSYDELSKLRKQLQSEFDKNFSTSPLSRTSFPFSEKKRVKDKIADFKV